VAVVDIQSEKASRVAQEINAEYGEGMSAKSLINAALAMPALYTSKSTREKISSTPWASAVLPRGGGRYSERKSQPRRPGD
jgi:hypothetical protein